MSTSKDSNEWVGFPEMVWLEVYRDEGCCCHVSRVPGGWVLKTLHFNGEGESVSTCFIPRRSPAVFSFDGAER